MNNKTKTSYYIGSTCGRGVKNISVSQAKKLSYNDLKEIYENNQYDDDCENDILVLMHDKLNELTKRMNSKVKAYNEESKNTRKSNSARKRQKNREELLKVFNNDKEELYKTLVQKNIFSNVRETEEYTEAVREYKRLHKSCELTGKIGKLVLHHKASVNSNPELACDKNNFVVITEEIHKSFHKQYGYGNNTPEQWNEFVNKIQQ